MIAALRKEVARLKAERDILKTIPGRRPPVRDRNAACYARPGRQRPFAYWWVRPRQKRGPWVHAHLRVVTPAVRAIPVRKMTNWRNPRPPLERRRCHDESQDR